MTTTVVHRREPHDIYIGRPSKWGNPFHVGGCCDRDTAIRMFREWLLEQPRLIADLHELRGMRLGCFCAPLACHGDVLAELADGFVDILGGVR